MKRLNKDEDIRKPCLITGDISLIPGKYAYRHAYLDSIMVFNLYHKKSPFARSLINGTCSLFCNSNTIVVQNRGTVRPKTILFTSKHY